MLLRAGREVLVPEHRIEVRDATTEPGQRLVQLIERGERGARLSAPPSVHSRRFAAQICSTRPITRTSSSIVSTNSLAAVVAPTA